MIKKKRPRLQWSLLLLPDSLPVTVALLPVLSRMTAMESALAFSTAELKVPIVPIALIVRIMLKMQIVKCRDTDRKISQWQVCTGECARVFSDPLKSHGP